jgi:hypothetical protein
VPDGLTSDDGFRRHKEGTHTKEGVDTGGRFIQGYFDLLATEPRLFGHDEHVERRAMGPRVHQPDEAWLLDELGAVVEALGTAIARTPPH